MKSLRLSIASLFGFAAAATSAVAGHYGNYGNTYTNPGMGATTNMPAGCQCFAAGTQGFSLYAASFSASKVFDRNAGAGLSYTLFPEEYYGFEAEATWGFAESMIHNFNASFIVRYPIPEMCLAPYAFIGAGIHTDGVKEGTWHIGLGLDMRLTQECLGIFADVRYVFAEEVGNHTLTRIGMRMNF